MAFFLVHMYKQTTMWNLLPIGYSIVYGGLAVEILLPRALFSRWRPKWQMYEKERPKRNTQNKAILGQK